VNVRKWKNAKYQRNVARCLFKVQIFNTKDYAEVRLYSTKHYYLKKFKLDISIAVVIQSCIQDINFSKIADVRNRTTQHFHSHALILALLEHINADKTRSTIMRCKLIDKASLHCFSVRFVCRYHFKHFLKKLLLEIVCFLTVGILSLLRLKTCLFILSISQKISVRN